MWPESSSDILSHTSRSVMSLKMSVNHASSGRDSQLRLFFNAQPILSFLVQLRKLKQCAARQFHSFSLFQILFELTTMCKFPFSSWARKAIKNSNHLISYSRQTPTSSETLWWRLWWCKRRNFWPWEFWPRKSTCLLQIVELNWIEVDQWSWFECSFPIEMVAVDLFGSTCKSKRRKVLNWVWSLMGLINTAW
jgi:hypothetical protein